MFRKDFGVYLSNVLLYLHLGKNIQKILITYIKKMIRQEANTK